MKSGRGRRFIRKLFTFFFPFSKAPTKSRPSCDSSSLCKESATSASHFEGPPEYSYRNDHCSKDHESWCTPCRDDLEDDIVQTWKAVYLGLYEINDNDDLQRRYHYDRIEALYLGAGLPDVIRVCDLHVLRRLFFRHHFNNGIVGLKLYDDMSISTLQSTLHLLRKYESEIVNLQRLYSLLRKRQLDLPDLINASASNTANTKREYLAIAAPMDRRIRQYDIRMNVLNHEIRDEAMEIGNGDQGQYVYYRAFAGRW